MFINFISAALKEDRDRPIKIAQYGKILPRQQPIRLRHSPKQMPAI
jgi:hypothetical protein